MVLKGRPLRDGGFALNISEMTLQQCARGVNEDVLSARVFACEAANCGRAVSPRLDTLPRAPYTLGFALRPVFATVGLRSSLELETRLLRYGVTERCRIINPQRSAFARTR